MEQNVGRSEKKMNIGTYSRNGTVEETSWSKQKTGRRMKTSDWI